MNTKSLNLKPSNVFFTSDLHFGHNNIIKYCNRPFENASEMDMALIENWNNTVPEDGIVFSVGDFAFTNIGHVTRILESLNGTIIMITGNHDRLVDKNRSTLLDSGLVHEIVPYKEITVQNQFICMFHYAGRVWNRSHHGSWLLYGHSHGTLSPFGKSVDVGVDSDVILGKTAYRPFTFDEIKSFMDTRSTDGESKGDL